MMFGWKQPRPPKTRTVRVLGRDGREFPVTVRGTLSTHLAWGMPAGTLVALADGWLARLIQRATKPRPGKAVARC